MAKPLTDEQIDSLMELSFLYGPGTNSPLGIMNKGKLIAMSGLPKPQANSR